MNNFLDQIFCERNNKYSLIIEDNGKVCYAYLMHDENIIGDVWLYNTEETPLEVDWSSNREMPFLNPAVYIDTGIVVSPITSRNDFDIKWVFAGNELKEVFLYVKDQITVKMYAGSKPGWSSIVAKNGPLAKKLE